MKSDSRPLSVVLEHVKALVERKLASSEAKPLNLFIDRLFQNVAGDDLIGRSDSDLYGATLSLWHGVQNFSANAPFIRVYTPKVDRHGWHSNHSVIELIQVDMPFLVDSVRMALNRLGITAHLLLHAPMAVVRDKAARITDLHSVDQAGKGTPITVFLIEVDQLSSREKIAELTDALTAVISEVQLAVQDWKSMENQLLQAITRLKSGGCPCSPEQKQEVLDFLSWLADHNFTLMGYRSYTLAKVEGDYALSANDDSSLGLMKNSLGGEPLKLSTLPDAARKHALSASPLTLTKCNALSRVHRPAYIDYVGIKRFNGDGEVVGEDRFIGLYAASVYNQSATEVPLVKQKVHRVLQQSGFSNKSHAYKALLNILETYPRDELFQSSEQGLLNVGLGVLQMQERDMTRLFVRRDLFGRFFSCLVYVPKERYSTQLRKTTQQLLARALGSSRPVEFTTFFSESMLARTQYLVHVPDNAMDVDVNAIEANLVEAARSWQDKFSRLLQEKYGQAKGKALAERYQGAFPPGYQEDVLPGMAVADIDQLERLHEAEQLGILFYRAQEEQSGSQAVRLKLFQRNAPIHLSDVLPILEHMGLRVIGERPYIFKPHNGDVMWVLEFSMTYTGQGELDLDSCQQRFQEALAQIWSGELENDGFNALILASGLSGREASVLRAYAKYMRQIGMSFSQQYIEQTLRDYPSLARALFLLFRERFDPTKSRRNVERLQQRIEKGLDSVASLDDDRIIRRYCELILATLRCNYYQTDEQAQAKAYLSFKLRPDLITEMPKPLPAFEIFVYSPAVEGVHLRGGKVARGGLRWSDRREDFRTEVLGLVKAQQVKNTVIVPVGAKGGFVCKQLPGGDREAILAEGQRCYRTFIRGLLDLTDNIIDAQVVPPPQLVRHDDDDTYLVVAADKGTATFSDIANAISAEYNFWLGDAFASGGSVGYDHKKMGITARGAWESVKRHFRELGIDCQTEPFTCIGVGDMAGDVFGNGMLLSQQIKLLAAFNHMHIFIDPDPDPAASYAERKRLFELPRSSWTDYDSALISKGGGVFLRSAKSIPLSTQMQALLNTDKPSLAPNDLIKQLLMLPVDLLWNGGIGTYVRSALETDAEVGDRANDAVRISGSQLNVKIVGEGGNLGMTQRGRIEYAAKGGRLNTDFTDNVGGVDCSDNEVNIKILLNRVVAAGDMTHKQRDSMLSSMTDEVARIVLNNSYRQTQSISVTQNSSEDQVKELQRFIHALEREGLLDRELEYLPSDDQLAERIQEGLGFTRPELAVLTAYGKMRMKEYLKIPEITSLAFCETLLLKAFPPRLQQAFAEQIAQHPLRDEIIATRLANDVVNHMGCNFLQRMQDETGAPVAEIAICYLMARELFELDSFVAEVEALDNQVKAVAQYRLLHEMRRTLRRATRWFLRHRDKTLSIEATITFYRPVLDNLWQQMESYLVEEELAENSDAIARYTEQGVGTILARKTALLTTVFSGLDIAQVVEQGGRPVHLVAEIYYKLGHRLELHWFLSLINRLPVANHWQALARASFREELDWQQRALCAVVLKYCTEVCEPEQMMSTWLNEFTQETSRWLHMLGEFKSSQSPEFAMFPVALRELMLLSHNCDNR